MLRTVMASVLAPVMGIAVLSGGFYLLYLAFLDDRPLPGVTGGGLVLLGTWLIIKARRADLGGRR